MRRECKGKNVEKLEQWSEQKVGEWVNYGTLCTVRVCHLQYIVPLLR